MSINKRRATSFASPIYLALISGLLLLCFSLNAGAATKSRKAKKKMVTNAWTVISIRPVNKGDDFQRITFTPSARFYKLPTNANPEWLRLLQESRKDHVPLMVSREKEESDVIIDVKKQK